MATDLGYRYGLTGDRIEADDTTVTTPVRDGVRCARGAIISRDGLCCVVHDRMIPPPETPASGLLMVQVQKARLAAARARRDAERAQEAATEKSPALNG